MLFKATQKTQCNNSTYFFFYVTSKHDVHFSIIGSSSEASSIPSIHCANKKVLVRSCQILPLVPVVMGRTKLLRLIFKCVDFDLKFCRIKFCPIFLKCHGPCVCQYLSYPCNVQERKRRAVYKPQW